MGLGVIIFHVNKNLAVVCNPRKTRSFRTGFDFCAFFFSCYTLDFALPHTPQGSLSPKRYAVCVAETNALLCNADGYTGQLMLAPFLSSCVL